MTTILPNDAMGNPIDALRLSPGRAQTIAVTATSTRNAIPFLPDTVVISLYSTVGCFIQTGNNSVTASAASHFLPAGFYITLSVKTDTHVAVIHATNDGTIYISELE